MFSPARPILRRQYQHTAASPRAKKGLATHWTPRDDPVQYKEGIERIGMNNTRHDQFNQLQQKKKGYWKPYTPLLQHEKSVKKTTPSEEFFGGNSRRVRTPKERTVEKRTWLQRPPPATNGLNDVFLFFSTLSNSWKVEKKNDLKNIDMHMSGLR